jgi:hypothetical protein
MQFSYDFSFTHKTSNNKDGVILSDKSHSEKEIQQIIVVCQMSNN